MLTPRRPSHFVSSPVLNDYLPKDYTSSRVPDRPVVLRASLAFRWHLAFTCLLTVEQLSRTRRQVRMACGRCEAPELG